MCVVKVDEFSSTTPSFSVRRLFVCNKVFRSTMSIRKALAFVIIEINPKPGNSESDRFAIYALRISFAIYCRMVSNCRESPSHATEYMSFTLW